MTDAAFEALLIESRPISQTLSRQFFAPGLGREDMEQIMDLAFWRAMPSFDPARSSVGTYARMVMRRAAQSVIKSAFADARRAHLDAVSIDARLPNDDGDRPRREFSAAEPGYVSLEDADWQEDLIAEARLSPLERESFLRILGNAYVPGVLDEIAADMGVSIGAVGNAWTRARGKLAAAVGLKRPEVVPGGLRVQVGWRLSNGRLCMDGLWYRLIRWSRAQPDCYEAEVGGQVKLILADRVIRVDASPWGGRNDLAVGITTGPWRQESFGWDEEVGESG